MTRKATPTRTGASDAPVAPTGPYTVSLSIDMDRVDGDSYEDALRNAIAALRLGIPALYSDLDFGGVAHVMPAKGPTQEWSPKRMVRVDVGLD